MFKTAEQLGTETVAVYLEADARSVHVRRADEAVFIGPSSQSHLQVDRIVEAARATGAQAIHPGYGFHSKSSDIPQWLADGEIEFVGPNAHVISSMGDKVELMRQARQCVTLPQREC